MTIEMCISICRDRNYNYAGLQWQCECHCGNEPENDFMLTWMGKCNDRCAGDSSQICGGSEAMNVWSTYLDTVGLCVHDLPYPNRILDEYFIGGYQNMTLEFCQLTCEGFCSKKSSDYTNEAKHFAYFHRSLSAEFVL